MRTQNVLKNSSYSIASYGILALLGLINRKVFIRFLNFELLGYEGLFTNIFSLLSLAEMGIGTVITYSLYKHIADGNQDEISKLMMIYKYMYRIIGLSVTLVGIGLFFFLPLIIKDNVLNWEYVRIIYLFQLFATVCTYFLSYKRILYLTHQREFICVKIDTEVKIITLVVQMAVLVFLKDYLLYLSCTILGNIIANLIIAKKCKKDFPEVKFQKVTLKDVRARGFFKDIKNFIVHKISYIVYGGTDNIVIGAILGIQFIALYSNYLIIKGAIGGIITKVTQPMQASIGNLVYAENKTSAKKLFDTFDLACFFLGTFVCISFITLFQPFISLFFGEKYLLSLSFVIMLSLNEYIAWQFQTPYLFRNAFGSYDNDKKYMVISAIVNLVLSISLSFYWGMTGIVTGTLIGHFFIIYGRIQFVFRQYFKKSMRSYLIRHLGFFFLMAIECLMTAGLASFLPTTLLGFIGKVCLCLIIPNGLNVLIFYRKQEFVEIKKYLMLITEIIKKKKRKI